MTYPERYQYPAEEKYHHLENHILFNVVAGVSYKEFDYRIFQVTTNEVSALFINKDAKFSKIFRKGTKKAFLLPHNFSDDAMRNYYLVKYHAFLDGGRVSDEVEDWDVYFFGGKAWSKADAPDFKEEHLERKRLEKEYLNCTVDISEQFGGDESEEVVDSDSDVESDSSTCFNELFDEDTVTNFLAEVKRCRKSATDSKDACIIEWELRMSTLNPVDQICQYLEHMCNGHVVTVCECSNRQSQICDTVCENLVRFFDLVKMQNRADTEELEYVSDLVFDTVFKLAQFKDQLIVALNSPCYVEEDLTMILCNVKVLFEYYVTYGCHDTKLFF